MHGIKTLAGNRQEARPLEWADMTDSQREAAERIAQSLLCALEDLEVTPAREDVPSDIDRYRPNQIFFVSGEPGSGKTALYLTIRELLNGRRKIDEEGFEALKELKDTQSVRLRWLEPLDLEPAAESANFLAAMLVRIEAAVMKNPRDRLPERRPGLLEDRDAMQELQRLQGDIVLAWDGTVPQRAERTDPDVFAQEVLRAEKALLRVNHRLREVLERFSPGKKEERVVYILPVDDFYLKPASSLEFLRFLRMISVPQLFILVLGDLDVISELFFQDMLGKLVRLAGEGSLKAITKQESILTARARGFTSHAMRKLLPPSQRSFLEAMNRLRALDFRPVRPGKTSEKERSLGELLGTVLTEFSSAILPKSKNPKNKIIHPNTILDFLLVQGRKVEESAEYYTYSGLGIMDLPPREVVDLWHILANLLGRERDAKRTSKKTSKVLGLVVDQTLEALDHETYLDLSAKERCREAIQGKPYYERTFQRDALEVEPKLGRGRRLTIGDGRVLVLSPHDGWIIRPNIIRPNREGDTELKNGEGGINYLAPRPTAWFTVLHDLMALSSGDRMEGDSLFKPFKLNWAYVLDEKSKTKFGWPTPIWPSFRHFDLLAFRWRKIVEALDAMTGAPSEDLRSWLTYNWLDSITEILKSESWDPGRALPELKIGKPQWQALNTDTLSLLDAIEKPGLVGGHQEVLRGWLLRLSLFLHPQFAVPPPVIEDIRKGRLERFWKREQKEIEDIRQAEVPELSKPTFSLRSKKASKTAPQTTGTE